ncbi:natterin-3-like [Engraulis encrasicolus]|uniref:natterin-3-like n=1 Tax=Engraulis encrasicolus TaxID=184585 RepID=UPI002FD3F54B
MRLVLALMAVGLLQVGALPAPSKQSSLDPSMEDQVPPISSEVVEGPSVPPELEGLTTKSYLFGDNVNLNWTAFEDALPEGAVGIYNGYTSRTDYICKFNCEAGFYTPSKGPYCNYAYGDREYHAPAFEILVNRDNFEFLEWKEDSYGGVPRDSVGTCNSKKIYVGKNKYGLGKVVPEHEAFFLPWEGDEYWYKSYQVLSINREAYTQHISHVEYKVNEVELFQYPPESMHVSSVTNNECREVTKTVSMQKSTEKSNSWNIGRATMLGITGTISVKIPFVGTGGVELGGEQTFSYDKTTTVTETIAHTNSIDLTVPPNHTCRVRMEGRKMKMDIPFKARLSRTYVNGETQWTSVNGMYDGVQVGEVRTVVERCEPVPDALPCF